MSAGERILWTGGGGRGDQAAEAGRQRAAEEEELAIRQAEEELARLLALKEEKDAAMRALHIELDEELKRTKEKEEENKKTNGELARITPKNKNLAKEVEQKQINLKERHAELEREETRRTIWPWWRPGGRRARAWTASSPPPEAASPCWRARSGKGRRPRPASPPGWRSSGSRRRPAAGMMAKLAESEGGKVTAEELSRLKQVQKEKFAEETRKVRMEGKLAVSNDLGVRRPGHYL